MAQSATTTKTMTETVIDPVCGMKVVPGETKLVALYKGHSYWFCAESCRKAFEANPKRYLEPKPDKPKGWWGRYLERMARANREHFGEGRPSCH